MSGTDPLPALRQAAAVLLAEAPLPVVRATLRALLAETEAAPVSPSPVRPPEPPTARAPAAPTPPRAATEWNIRRREFRAAMLRREVSYRDLAEEFGVALATIRGALQTQKPPTHAMRQRLETWLARAEETTPEVVATAAPFRNGAGNGADHHARAG